MANLLKLVCDLSEDADVSVLQLHLSSLMSLRVIFSKGILIHQSGKLSQDVPKAVDAIVLALQAPQPDAKYTVLFEILEAIVYLFPLPIDVRMSRSILLCRQGPCFSQTLHVLSHHPIPPPLSTYPLCACCYSKPLMPAVVAHKFETPPTPAIARTLVGSLPRAFPSGIPPAVVSSPTHLIPSMSPELSHSLLSLCSSPPLQTPPSPTLRPPFSSSFALSQPHFSVAPIPPPP